MRYQVAVLLEGAALREFDDQALLDILGVGALTDDEGVVEDGVGGELDVSVALDLGDFRSDSADDVTVNPAAGGLAALLDFDGAGYVVGVSLGAGTLGTGLSEAHAALIVVEDELPAGGAVVRKDADNVAYALGEGLVPEVGVAGGAHVQGVALGVGEGLVYAAGVVGRESLGAGV